MIFFARNRFHFSLHQAFLSFDQGCFFCRKQMTTLQVYSFTLKNSFMKQVLLSAKAFLFFGLVVLSQGFSNRAGGDYFKVLLNNQLITEQYLYKPTTIKTLSLASTNNNDHLTVYYSHCGMAGTGRNILLKDQSGKLLGKWDFADSKQMELQLPVKDLLKRSGKNSSALLYYASKEIPSGRPLISVEFLNKVVANL